MGHSSRIGYSFPERGNKTIQYAVDAARLDTPSKAAEPRSDRRDYVKVITSYHDTQIHANMPCRDGEFVFVSEEIHKDFQPAYSTEFESPCV